MPNTILLHHWYVTCCHWWSAKMRTVTLFCSVRVKLYNFRKSRSEPLIFALHERNNVFYIIGKFVWEFYIEFCVIRGHNMHLHVLVRKGLKLLLVSSLSSNVIGYFASQSLRGSFSVHCKCAACKQNGFSSQATHPCVVSTASKSHSLSTFCSQRNIHKEYSEAR